MDDYQDCEALCWSQRLLAVHLEQVFSTEQGSRILESRLSPPHLPELNKIKPSSTHALLSQLNNKNNLPISPHTETFRVFIKSKGTAKFLRHIRQKLPSFLSNHLLLFSLKPLDESVQKKGSGVFPVPKTCYK